MLFAVVAQIVRRGRADEVEQRLCLPELTALPAKATFIVAVIQQAFQVLLCKIAAEQDVRWSKVPFQCPPLHCCLFFRCKDTPAVHLQRDDDVGAGVVDDVVQPLLLVFRVQDKGDAFLLARPVLPMRCR